MAAGLPKEVEALGQVLKALHGLEEGQREWVMSSAMTNLGLAMTASKPSVSGASQGGVHEAISETIRGMTPKEFLRVKNPQTDVQRIAALAYYLTHERGVPHFKTKDLTALNIEAAGTKLSNASFAVNNATKQNHFLAPAGSGKKQITSLGEDVVNALPEQEAVRALAQTQRKRKAKKRNAKKG
jgi:hypothetical protein